MVVAHIKLNDGRDYTVKFSVENPLIKYEDILGLKFSGDFFFEDEVMIARQNLFDQKLLHSNSVH